MTASPSPAQRVLVPEHVTTRDLHGELVLLNFDSETYFGLDAVGTRIWSVLSESETVEDGVQTLLGEFDVEEERLRRDVSALLEKLIDGGLVELRDV